MRDKVLWYGCYKSIYDLWCKDSYAHPAKLAPGLGFRIIEHLEDIGLLRPGGVVLDFMAGIGSIPLIAALKGYRAIGVELEPRFYDFCLRNQEYVEAKARRKLDITWIKGDSRNLAGLLQERGLVGITSPPYPLALTGGGIAQKGYSKPGQKDKIGGVAPDPVGQRSYMTENVGGTPGQIAQLSDDGRVPVIGITSPPYGDSLNARRNTNTNDESRGYKTTPLRYSGEGPDPAPEMHPGQIGNMRDDGRIPIVGITSPPYGDIAAQFRNTGSRIGGDKFHYGSDDPNNIGNLPDEGDYPDTTKAAWWRKKAVALATETYLEAMLGVYKAAASVCDVLVTITKNPTRDRKLRRLDKDTLALLRLAGFEPACYHQAVLFQEVQEYDLFGGSKKQPKGRLSFFRRLAYTKGLVIADHEDILICVGRNKDSGERTPH